MVAGRTHEGESIVGVAHHDGVDGVLDPAHGEARHVEGLCRDDRVAVERPASLFADALDLEDVTPVVDEHEILDGGVAGRDLFHLVDELGVVKVAHDGAEPPGTLRVTAGVVVEVDVVVNESGRRHGALLRYGLAIVASPPM